MYKDIVDYIGGIAIRHKAVKECKYQKRILINAQNSSAYMQCVIEDDAYIQMQKTEAVTTATINIDMLAFPKEERDVLPLQSLCYQVCLSLMQYITDDKSMRGQISIWDWSALFLSHYTDDDACGCRLTLELLLPNFVSLCDYMNDFEENAEIEEEEEGEIDLDVQVPEVSQDQAELVLRPIKLR